jgi:hypothetical protein
MSGLSGTLKYYKRLRLRVPQPQPKFDPALCALNIELETLHFCPRSGGVSSLRVSTCDFYLLIILLTPDTSGVHM